MFNYYMVKRLIRRDITMKPKGYTDQRQKIMNRDIPISKIILYFFGTIFIIYCLFNIFYTIQSGQEGVLLTWDKASLTPIQPGLHLKIPIVQNIVKFDVRTQKYSVDNSGSTLESAASSDLQVVKVRLAVNYHLTPGKTPEIFTNIGEGYADKVLLPTLNEVTKSVIAQYQAADLIDKRENVRVDIENLLKQKLMVYNIIIEQVSITDFDFSDQFNQAIEAKVTAIQLKDKAQNDLERIKIEAEQTIAKAQGDSQAIQIINDQLAHSPEYTKYLTTTKWDGHLPQVVGGAMPLVSIPTTNISG